MSARTRSLLRPALLAVLALALTTVGLSSAATAGDDRGRLVGPHISSHDGVLRYADPRVAGLPGRKISGILRVAPAEARGQHTRYGVTVGGVTVPVDLGAVGASIRPGSRFTGRLVADPSTSVQNLRKRTSRVATATITSAAAPTTRRALLAAPTNLGTPPSDATVLASAQKMVDYWKEQSSGAITSFTRSSTVLKYKTAYAHPHDCGLGEDVFDFADEARAKFSGLGAGDTVVVFVPASCFQGGSVGVSTGGVTVNIAGIYLNSVLAHEEGHELGIDHANALDPDGTVDEYYDITSAMGLAFTWNDEPINQHTALNSLYRSYLGWALPGELQAVTLPATATSTTIETVLQPRASDTGRRGVRVQDPDSNRVWYVEYRHAMGRDVGSAYDMGLDFFYDWRRGISVLRQDHDRPTASVLMDVGPPETNEWGDLGDAGSALGTGQSWTSPDGRLKVEFLTDSGQAGATVRITVTSSKPAVSAGTPVVNGVPEVGGSLTVAPGTWTAGATLAYRWLVDGTPVAGATSATFKPRAADEGKSVAAEVTGSKSGFRSAMRTSAAVGPVVPMSWAPKTPTFPTPRVGKLLTVVPDWGTGVTFTYRWYLGSTAITNATRPTYTPTASQLGKYLSVKVTGSKPGHPATSKVSAKVLIAKGILTTVVPTITGTPKVGQTLYAHHGTWTAGTTFTYRWLSNGVAITNATASSYKLPSSKVGKNIKVKVTGHKPGYTAVSRISAAVGPVVR